MDLLLFVTVALILLFTPGPAVLYIVTRSVEQGRAAGFASVLGLAVGSLFHIFAAVLGLSALLATSRLAFAIVKIAGAAYLIYLGLQRFRDRSPKVARDVEPAPVRRIFAQGIVVNLLNPKTALFFLAFLPQFVDVSKGHVAAQILFLGMVFLFLSLLTDSVYAAAAGEIGARLKFNPRIESLNRYAAGAVYIALGVVAGLSTYARK